MKFSIKPLDLHHYEIYLLQPIRAKIFNKTSDKKYVGSATINLTGTDINVYCEDTKMNDYAELLGQQTYLTYVNQLEKINNI